MKSQEFPDAKYRIIDMLVTPEGSLFFVIEQTEIYKNEKEYQLATQKSTLRVLSELYENERHPLSAKMRGEDGFLFVINSSLAPIFTNTFTVPSQLKKLRSFFADKITPDKVMAGENHLSRAINFLAAWINHWQEIVTEDAASDAEAEQIYGDLLTLMSEISGKINCSGYAASLIVGIWVKNLLDQTPSIA